MIAQDRDVNSRVIELNQDIDNRTDKLRKALGMIVMGPDISRTIKDTRNIST